MLSTKELKAVVSWLNAPMLREADEDDADRLLQYFKLLAAEPLNNTSIRRSVFQQTPDEQREFIRSYAHAENSRLFVLDAGDEIVAMLRIAGSANPATAHVVELSLNVHPHYRGSGFGSALLRHALAWAQSQQTIRRVQLEVATRNESAIRLYERFGFQVEGHRRPAYHLFDEPGAPYVDTYVMAVLL
jgi:putative acetyltransferase